MLTTSDTPLMRRSSFCTSSSFQMSRFLALSLRKLISATCIHNLAGSKAPNTYGVRFWLIDWQQWTSTQAAQTKQLQFLQCHFWGGAHQLQCRLQQLYVYRPHCTLSTQKNKFSVILLVISQSSWADRWSSQHRSIGKLTVLPSVWYNTNITADVCGSQAIRGWFYILKEMFQIFNLIWGKCVKN